MIAGTVRNVFCRPRSRAVKAGRGGRTRTRADAVLETAALPLSYSPVRRGAKGRMHLSDL